MRMWMVDPRTMCTKHLLGEHGEIHKHRHNFVKKHSIKGRIIPKVQIEPLSMKRRHDMLADEMRIRGMNHKSPYEMPDISYLPDELRLARVPIFEAMNDLHARCELCKKTMREFIRWRSREIENNKNADEGKRYV